MGQSCRFSICLGRMKEVTNKYTYEWSEKLVLLSLSLFLSPPPHHCSRWWTTNPFSCHFCPLTSTFWPWILLSTSQRQAITSGASSHCFWKMTSTKARRHLLLPVKYIHVLHVYSPSLQISRGESRIENFLTSWFLIESLIRSVFATFWLCKYCSQCTIITSLHLYIPLPHC